MFSYSLFDVLACLAVGLGYGAFTLWWLGRWDKKQLRDRVGSLEARIHSSETELSLAAASLGGWVGKAGELSDCLLAERGRLALMEKQCGAKDEKLTGLVSTVSFLESDLKQRGKSLERLSVETDSLRLQLAASALEERRRTDGVTFKERELERLWAEVSSRTASLGELELRVASLAPIAAQLREQEDRAISLGAQLEAAAVKAAADRAASDWQVLRIEGEMNAARLELGKAEALAEDRAKEVAEVRSSRQTSSWPPGPTGRS